LFKQFAQNHKLKPLPNYKVMKIKVAQEKQ
jgi:hypothetical protein